MRRCGRPRKQPRPETQNATLGLFEGSEGKSSHSQVTSGTEEQVLQRLAQHLAEALRVASIDQKRALELKG